MAVVVEERVEAAMEAAMEAAEATMAAVPPQPPVRMHVWTSGVV